MNIVDLSVPLDNNRDWAPWWARNRVIRQNHRFGQRAIRWLLGLKKEFLQDELGWANDEIKLSTHGTTHVDAPWHYGPTCNGQPARTIDQMPLDWFHGPGVVLDMRHLESDVAAGVDDLKRACEKIEHEIDEREIVLIQTGNDRLLRSKEYFSAGPGVSAAATDWLLDQGVRLTGIDSWGWDMPLKKMAALAKERNDRSLFWEAHYVGTRREYCHMERLANLNTLPPTGFTVCAFPLKVVGGSAGPARVVAMLDDASEEKRERRGRE